MRLGVAAAALVSILPALLVARASAASTPSTTPVSVVTPDKIDSAIQKAKTFLYSKESGGSWDSRPPAPDDPKAKRKKSTGKETGKWGEQTALVTFALLAAGDEPQDDKLVPPLKLLQDSELKGVYAMGLKAQIYPFLSPTTDRKRNASADTSKLIAAQLTQTTGHGFYGDVMDPKDVKRVDYGASLHAVLGIWACERAGAEISEGYWRSVQDAWLSAQDASGAFSTKKSSGHGGASVSLTTAGLTILFITQDHLHAANVEQLKGNISNPHIDSGLDWLAGHFDRVLSDHAQRPAPFNTLFSVERLGMTSGLKYFGSVNWYEVGANYLLQTQSSDGSWGGSLASTSFAVLFLSHAKMPVVFDKLQYSIDGKPGNWNQRPRDVRNLVDWIGQEVEGDLNWQIVDLKAPMAELHDAPILYIAGNQPLQFTTQEDQKLREFCEEGGIILGNSDGATDDFANSFRALGARLFPDDEFRELPADHPIYTDEQWRRAQWKSPPRVLSLSNGVREMMVLMPTDLAKAWELKEVVGNEESFQFADDLYLYARGVQNLQESAKPYAVYPDEKIHPGRNITIARLEYDGNWNPEPAGWRRLAAILHNSFDINLTIFQAKLGTGALDNLLKDGVKIAHLTGTTRLKLGERARSELRKFVEAGGTLIVDAAGGSQDFATSVEGQLGDIFGPAAAEELKRPLAPGDPVYKLSASEITDFRFRPYARKTMGDIHGPQLSAIHVHGRPAVFYSSLDLSAGLVGSPVDGIVGYEPDTATDIMRNLLMTTAPASSQLPQASP